MRLYMHGKGTPVNEDINRYLLYCYDTLEQDKSRMSKQEFEKWNFYTHNTIRDSLHLPNMIFSIGCNKEKTKAFIIFFNKEPNGKTYRWYKDEEKKSYYIMINEEDNENE